ncbi:rCG63241 [Rattus norvegicus]|uniref:RCG63241 n=1 Tax=Rattus norvegicus TaxID=10116 RepID=A6JPA9_RAT|nr:rCG63241 [Rattus norvegicus]
MKQFLKEDGSKLSLQPSLILQITQWYTPTA